MQKRLLMMAMMAMGLVGGIMAMAQGQKPLDLPRPVAEQPELPLTTVDLPLRPHGVLSDAIPATPSDDPMHVVEAFVVRNRKEAAESIETLTKEAELLRARLQKVEAALERWKAVENALRQDAAVPVPPPVEAIQKK
jgi:hypothetical protein